MTTKNPREFAADAQITSHYSRIRCLLQSSGRCPPDRSPTRAKRYSISFLKRGPSSDNTSFLGPKPRSGVIAAGVIGAVLLLAVAWAVIVWSRPAPIRIAFANSLTGPSGPAGPESLSRRGLHRRGERQRRDQAAGPSNSSPSTTRAAPRRRARTFRRLPTARALPCSDIISARRRLAAGPGYKSVRIPALTGTSFVDDLTRDNEFYFRAQTTSSLQGRSIAEYLRAVHEGAAGSSRPLAATVSGRASCRASPRPMSRSCSAFRGLTSTPTRRIGSDPRFAGALCGAIRAGRHRHRDRGRFHRRHRESGASARRQGADHGGRRRRP